ncbi:MAG: PHB depolymerase family esterase [Sandaracinaceae bacterium]
MRLQQELLFALTALIVGCQTPDDAFTDTGSPPVDGGLTLDGGGDAGAPTPQAFRSAGRQLVTECPLRAAPCASWPTTGTIYRYEAEERFGAQTHTRAFYVYVPEGVGPSAPVWIQLHGGYGSGARMLVDFGGMELSTGEPVGWGANTGGCRFDPFIEPLLHRDDAGEPCTPEPQTTWSTERFILVFPEGIEDASGFGRHWEDGRVPSPGQGTTEEQRDDVGFMDHVVSRLRAETDAFGVDPTRIYLSGLSNGGMMTARVICALGDPAYPELTRIAAFGVMIATLPEALALGLDGRTACPEETPTPVPVHYMVGRGIPTFGGVTDGDGRVPWGSAGEIYMQDFSGGGRVFGVDDSLDSLRGALERSSGAATVEETGSIGVFTTWRRFGVPTSAAEVELLATDGGLHSTLSHRGDFVPTARVWAFMSRYRLDGDELTRGESAIRGTY